MLIVALDNILVFLALLLVQSTFHLVNIYAMYLPSSTGRTEPTPRRDRHVLQGGSGVCGGGGATVRAERAQLRGGEWPAAMVHRGMLHRPRRRSDDRAGSHGPGGPAQRHRPCSGGGPEHRPGGDGM